MKRTLPSLLLGTLALLSGCDSSPEPEPGRVVGLYATVLGANGDILSNEFELNLITRGAPSASQQSPPSSAKLNSPNARLIRAPGAYYEETVASAQALQTSSEAAADCDLQPTALATLDDKLCWISEKVAASSLGRERSLTRLLFFTPDGAYHAIVEATGLQTSLSFASSGFSMGTGCIANPTPDIGHISVDYLESLLGLGFSTSIMFYDFGITSFFTHEGGLQRGFQYDTGVSFAFSPIPFLDFSVSLDESSSFLVKPTRVTGSCQSQVADGDSTSEVFADNTGNPFTAITAGLETIGSQKGESYQAIMVQETARSALRSFSPLASPGTSASQTAPAATQADLSAGFFARSGSTLCDDCDDYSIDSLLYRVREDLGATAGDVEQTKAVVAQRFADYQRSAPGAVPYALAQRYGSNALRLAFLAHEEQSAILRGDTNRYLDANIIDIEAQVGVATELTITTEEIAELLNLPGDRLLGATITVDASPHLEPADFALTSEGLSLELTPANTDSILVRFDVDLTTAAGSFPNDVGDWKIRPAMRRIHPQSGQAAAISLGAPVRSIAGNPLTLTAMVTDDQYAPVDSGVMVRFFDGRDRLLGEAPVVRGTAQLTVSLNVSEPVIAEVQFRQVLQNDTPVDGIEVNGFELSLDAKVLVDGISLADTDAAFAVLNSKTIVIVLEGSGIGSGQHLMQIINPGDIASESVSFIVGQE